MEWISTKVQDLKHLLGDHATMEEGIAILRNGRNSCSTKVPCITANTLAIELEEAMQFIVPMAHREVAMNECHRDTVHQGQQWTLSLLQDQFWWPRMAKWMQRAISSTERCIQHEGAWAKASLQTILITSPLELFHVDFNDIETTMELDQPLQVVNVFVFCDHFTRHIMAYMTPDQTAKTFAKYLWQGYISIWPSSWVTEEPTVRATSSVSCVSSWAFGKQELHCSTPRQTGRWSKLTKHWCGWLENWVKIGRQTGLSTYQNW